ncbi:DUF885 family protein [Brevundimonas sp.]|jgi:uncharacterized protein (DUF885 family)|uniref:DUF885 domain-containing protein n=1 Tax=Brevundimonas sp. TaxID=1871086 RepID=UPI001843B06D|nr:DUF885 family protein [Brevundimonas sp.]MBA4808332.1 DUF885 domain-containing protein [Brevundimonas sp.]
MIDRRRLMLSVAGAGLASALPAFARTPEADARLDALLTGWFDEDIEDSPESATSLGLDKGDRAELSGRLSQRGPADVARDKARAVERWRVLQTFPKAELSPASLITYEIAAFNAETGASAARFDYGNVGGGGRQGPYVVTQMSGAYFTVPDFLENQHRIETTTDAEAFLERVEAFGDVLDQETQRVRADGDRDIVLSTVLMQKTLDQLNALSRMSGADMAFVKALGRKTAERGIPGDWSTRAAALVEEKVKPALSRQAETLKAQQPRSSEDVGLWRFPQGDALYAQNLKTYTTTDLSGGEIHRMGLEQVAEISAEIDAILKAQGMTRGTVGERIAALNADPAQLWPNTDAGKMELIASLNAQVEALQPLLPRMFGHLPKSKVEVRRVPPSIEVGAPGGYYQAPTLDGSRPGAYYINLRDTANWPKFSLPTLTYHEASPGHHLQVALAREMDSLPIYRRAGGFSAFNEGWALYAEGVAANDLDVYADDPLGRVGFLGSYLFRAVRLVVDTGLHHERWSRQRAIDYMAASGAKPGDASASEIDRYCVMPGQACSYKIGHTVIAGLRREAEARPGFDLKAFHDKVLANGSVPLSVLQKIMTA